MNKIDIKKLIADENSSIVDAMELIDDNAMGILFIVDSDDRLTGCVTDGDIRRWIIRTGELNATVSSLMKKDPKFLFKEEKNDSSMVMSKYKITALPILDTSRRIVEVVFASDLETIANTKDLVDLSSVPVVIMAGGKGTRLYPYTKILPKPLIPIGDTPIIERIINCFTQYNIAKYFITVNYKKGMIKSYFADLNLSYQIEYVEESKPLGTGGSIKLINEKFDKPIFVANCDALILADYGDLYEYHKRAGNDITIVSALKNITVPYGVLRTRENGELVDMEEKPKLSYFINTGMYIINPETISLIPDDTFFHMTHLVEAVKVKGGKVGMYPVSEDSFLDMGEFGEIHRMEKKLHIEE